MTVSMLCIIYNLAPRFRKT